MGNISQPNNDTENNDAVSQFSILENVVKHTIEDKEAKYGTNELILSFNIRSLNKGKDELCRFLEDVTQIRAPALILLQETQMKQQEMLAVKIYGYRVINTTNQESSHKSRPCRLFS